MTHMNDNREQNKWQGSLIDDPEFLKMAIGNFLQRILDEQFKGVVNANPFERTFERRGYRNGSYDRNLKTRVGNVHLRVCRDREGQFKPELFEQYQRSEKALVLGVMEMYLKGVSTRKVQEVIEPLCGFNISKSQVSTLTKDLQEDIDEWRSRSLDKPFSYVVFDARYEKVRDGGRVVSKAFVIGVGIDSTGNREILGTWMINSESFEGWDECISDLKNRGLTGVSYVVSDDNKGLRRAIEKHFQGVIWQRCQVHFMRNFTSKLSKSLRKEGIQLLKDVFQAPNEEAAKERLEPLREFLHKNKKGSVCDWLEKNIEECFGVFDLPIEHRRKMKSTNMLERFNQELKRRSRVVRIFPNDESCLRILTSLCMDQSEEWSGRRYLDMAV